MAISAYPIAAAAGCFKRESGVNPGIWESLIVPSDTFYHVYQFDNIGGYGFGQFTNVGDTGYMILSVLPNSEYYVEIRKTRQFH